MAAPKKISRNCAHSAVAGIGHEESYLFVYGTLMSGQRSHQELIGNWDVQFTGPAKIQGELYRFRNVNYPGAVPSTRPDRFVHGQLYVLRHPERALQSLDEFEGCGEGLFRRVLANAWTDGRKVKAWTYFYARPLQQADLVPNGTYESA
jgi:gamma-glutamylcyclotransferase (GGCT)/AIG2-like uncharacterized protein YtfP